MPIVYANIGSNIGNKRALIEKALKRISDIFGVCCLSSYIETDPWGFETDNRFLNLGVSFKTNLDPEQILDILQDIEKEISSVPHRNKDGSYKDRELDIDIMDIEGYCYHSERLIIPHVHLSERDFFLIPLAELKYKNNTV